MRQRLVRSVIALLVLGACKDATGPGRFAGSYLLERYEGTSLPATIYESATTSVTILRQFLILGEDGTGVATMTSRFVDPGRPQGLETTTTSLLRFRVRSEAIEITFVCPPDADCVVQPLVGARIDGGLAISSPASSRPASIYRRVR